jgi:hypothetical protein
MKYVIVSYSQNYTVRWYWNQDIGEWNRLNRATIYPTRKAAEEGRESTHKSGYPYIITRYIITLNQALVQEIMTS